MALSAKDSLAGWTPERLANFSRQPLVLPHRYHEHELFSDNALARILEKMRREDYYVNTMDIRTHDPATRQEGVIRDLSGHQILDCVRRGRIWILLRDPCVLDARYQGLLDELYEAMEQRMPEFRTRHRKLSILVSSPNIQVYYHCDIPGQTLWQVRGRKKVMVYPNRPPYLPQPALEKIVMGQEHEISLAYDPAYDAEAVTIELEPGQMAHWPLNSPHRVINHDCINVSFTTEHFTRAERQQYYNNFANGVLRQSGFSRVSQRIAYPSYWLKLGLAAAYKLTGAHKRASQVRNELFAVDPAADGCVRSLSARQ